MPDSTLVALSRLQQIRHVQGDWHLASPADVRAVVDWANSLAAENERLLLLVEDLSRRLEQAAAQYRRELAEERNVNEELRRELLRLDGGLES